jgi:hypothetical protein
LSDGIEGQGSNGSASSENENSQSESKVTTKVSDIAAARADEAGAAEAAKSDRRQHKRRGVKINRLIRGSIKGDDLEPEEFYLYLVDVSERGLRLNLDHPLPEGRGFQLTFSLEDSKRFDSEVWVSWQKCLAGGTWTAGLEVKNITAPTREAMSAMLEDFSTQGRRMRFRLRQILSVTIRREGDVQWWNVTTLDLSPDGLQFRWDEPLDVETRLDINLFPQDLPEVHGKGQIMWQREVLPGRYEFGIKFVELESDGASVIQRYIDRCVGAA